MMLGKTSKEEFKKKWKELMIKNGRKTLMKLNK